MVMMSGWWKWWGSGGEMMMWCRCGSGGDGDGGGDDHGDMVMQFDKPAVQEQLLCVTTFNKFSVQKAKLVPKTVEKQVLTKLVTLQTLPQKKNVNASCDSCDVMYVSCAKSCLINCHDKCVAKYVNSVKHKARRALCTSPLAVKTRFVDASPIAPRASLVVITHVNAKDKASSSRSKSLEFLKVSTPNHNLWDVIVNEDLEEEPAPTTRETFAPPAPKTAKQLAARRNQERVKSILLLAIPDEYLLKFHNVADAKSLWEAIKSRFGGNVESKKMQKNVLKHQFENFSTASNESLDKAYDRFQKLISQLEVHGAPISKEDINQKFLRSLPSSWNQIALIMRNKPDIDEIDIDDLYNNLRVYEDELKRSSGSNSASQNLAFLSSENTGGTNEVSTASGDFGVSTAGGINQVPSTPCAHDVAYSFLAQPTTSPQLENEDFQQMDGDDLEELDLRWQVAMLTVRVKKFIQRTGRNLDFKEK
ncbi:hypothetical protein Tco_1218020 [Tanacetum coccineum]